MGPAPSHITNIGTNITSNTGTITVRTTAARIGSGDSHQCTVEIENKCSEYTLVNPQVYTFHGFYESNFPPTLGPSESGSGQFKKAHDTATGAVGVFTYDLQSNSTKTCDEKMAFMYSVPFDNSNPDLYAVGVFDVNAACDYDLYHKMYYEEIKEFARDEPKHALTYKGKFVTITATMSDTVIKVQVFSGSCMDQ